MEAVVESAQPGRGLERWQIPLSVRDSVLGRTTGLDDTASQVLKYAAVIGRAFDFELLLGLTGLREEQLLSAITALVERQLVAEVRQEGEDRYVFRHALTREAIYEDLLGREKRRMHLEVLGAIERSRAHEGNGRVDQLAYHSLKARELEKAAHYAGHQPLHARENRQGGYQGPPEPGQPGPHGPPGPQLQAWEGLGPGHLDRAGSLRPGGRGYGERDLTRRAQTNRKTRRGARLP